MTHSKPNILFIVLDTCRFDVFDELMGEGKLPYLLELINDSIYYTNAISPAAWTTPSHVSFFTGLYPSEHKVHETMYLKQSSMIMNQILNFPGKVLPEVLRTNGYNTYGFVANPNLAPGSGFERGFTFLTFVDMFEELSEFWNKIRQDITIKFKGEEKGISNLANNFDLKELRRFLIRNWNFLKLPRLLRIYREFLKNSKKISYPEQKAGKQIANIISNSVLEYPFFLFVNFMEMHDPYIIGKGEFFSGEAKKMLSYLVGKTELSSSLLNHYKRLYYRELVLLDQYIGKILDKLRKEGVYDDTVIVITADHGQNFGEDHYYGHGVLLSDSLVKVPLIIKPTGKTAPFVNHKIQPLANIFKFMVRCSEGVVNPNLIHSEIAYSESFGIQDDYREMFKLDSDLINRLESFDHHSIAVYLNNTKVIVSVGENEFKIESITSQNGNNSLDESELAMVNEQITKFLGFRYVNVSRLGGDGKLKAKQT